MIGRSGERGSGISVLPALYDDDDDDDDVCTYVAKAVISGYYKSFFPLLKNVVDESLY